MRREAALAAAGLFITHARDVRLQDVDLSYESRESRPSLIARDVSGLSLEEVKMQKFAGNALIRLDQIGKLHIRRCPGLADRTIEHSNTTEE